MKTNTNLTAAGLALLTLVANCRESSAEPFSASSAYSNSSSSSWSSSDAYASSNGPRFQSISNKVAMKNVSILQAISIVAQSGARPIFLSEEAARVIRKSNATMTIATKDVQEMELLRQILAGLPVQIAENDAGLQILAKMESLEDATVRPLGETAMEAALDVPITLHLDFIPAPMALQMIEGFAGVPILYEGGTSPWMTEGPLVSIHADAKPASEVLKDVAKQTDRRVNVLPKRVVLVQPEK